MSNRTLNDSGLVPLEFRCVVRLDPAKEKIGNIYVPDERKERDQMASTKATLLEVGGNAFEDWKGRVPKAGERVLINKYAGQFKEADPTDLYRVVNDKEILAILTDD